MMIIGNRVSCLYLDMVVGPIVRGLLCLRVIIRDFMCRLLTKYLVDPKHFVITRISGKVSIGFRRFVLLALLGRVGLLLMVYCGGRDIVVMTLVMV